MQLPNAAKITRHECEQLGLFQDIVNLEEKVNR